jgi:hypothetical protein
MVIEFCGGGTCHYDNAAMEVASSLGMWDRQANQMVADIHTRLVGVEATYRNVPDPENCPIESELLVDPSDIEQSLILKKLEGRQTCGVEMPKFPYPEWGMVATPGPRREAFVSCIRAWVVLLVEDYKQHNSFFYCLLPYSTGQRVRAHAETLKRLSSAQSVPPSSVQATLCIDGRAGGEERSHS